jgi:hypothetical protein
MMFLETAFPIEFSILENFTALWPQLIREQTFRFVKELIFWAQVSHAIAQVVSCWLPTMAAWVCVRAAREVCGGQRGIGASFL